MPTVQEAGWASEPVWTQRLEEKSLAPTVTTFSKVMKEDTRTDIATNRMVIS
jgi:hypothetical protein